MKIVTYMHVSRCLLPCGGVGRHANNMVSRLAGRDGIEVMALFSRAHVNSGGQAPENFPLRDLPAYHLPGRELAFERIMRLTGYPRLDRFGGKADWYYSPMESPMPTKGVPTAMTLHDVAIFEPDLPWSRSRGHRRAQKTGGLWVPRALRSVDRVLTVSHYSKARMVELLGADPDRVHVVGNGVDEVFFAKGAEVVGRIEKTDEVVVLGGLRYKKGADHVLAVAEALARRGSPLKIIVIGQNESAYAAKAKDCPNIEINGMLPDDVVVERMAQACAVMLLSLYEGFGIPPLEGMAVGTPAVVSNIASLPEVVGDAGIVIDPTHHDEIADRLEMLRTDGALYADLVARGRAHVQAYSWDRCTDRLLEALS